VSDESQKLINIGILDGQLIVVKMINN